MKKVAFVVQRCGIEVNGGAEVLCLSVAQHMAKYWHVEVLTTCALDYMGWDNHYKPGVEQVGAVAIRRFPVDKPRDMKSFEPKCVVLDKMFQSDRPAFKAVPLEEQEAWMEAQGPVSSQLARHLREHKHEYDAFIFFTYLYATTYQLLPLVQEKAFLAPFAHDEWPIYMTMWDQFFARPKGILFHSIEEKAFLESRFSHLTLRGPIAGVAIEKPAGIDPQRFRKKYALDAPFVVYVGRVDPLKGCHELIDYFIRLKKRKTESRMGRVLSSVRRACGSGSRQMCDMKNLKLVMIGRSVADFPKHQDILELGFVDELTKWDALAACEALVMPSPYESLSMAILEAWLVQKPVLVNGNCSVLVGQCQRSQGGLSYKNFDSFQAGLQTILPEEVSKQMGLAGKSYTESTYSWPVFAQQYITMIDSLETH